MCVVCGKTFNTPDNLKWHGYTHTGQRPKKVRNGPSPEKKHKCEFCDKKFLRKIYLVNHLRKHTDEKPWVCKICNKSYKAMISLKLHNFNNHDGPGNGLNKSYLCPLCNKLFENPTQLSKHMVTHTENRAFLCEHCPKSFTSAKYLKIHVRSVHESIKPYACQVSI